MCVWGTKNVYTNELWDSSISHLRRVGNELQNQRRGISRAQAKGQCRGWGDSLRVCTLSTCFKQPLRWSSPISGLLSVVRQNCSIAVSLSFRRRVIADSREFKSGRCPVMDAPAEALVPISVWFPLSCKTANDKSDKGEKVEMKMIIQSTYLYLYLATINMHVKPNIILTCTARQLTRRLSGQILRIQGVNPGGCGGPPNPNTGGWGVGGRQRQVSWSKLANQIS